MSKIRNNYAPEVRERAVRMTIEHRADYGSEWEAAKSIAPKFGCTPETLRRANEILRKASAYFAMAELDRHGK